MFSGIDVSKKLLPDDYTYESWNLDALKGSLVLTSDSVFIYGKTGVYLTDKQFSSFDEYNQGFNKGVDNRSVTAMIRTKKAGIIAGTLSGLYQLHHNKQWREIKLPLKSQRITDLTNKGDTLVILTRNSLLKTIDLSNFEEVQLPAPSNYKKQTSWFKFLWNLHSGELFGLVGKLFVDILGLVVIVLCVTGLIHFFYPKIYKKETRSEPKQRQFKKSNLKWHNALGYMFVLFLFFNVLAGMFLRPPLLIAIAKAKVGIIPFTHLDDPNPWQDKLRRITWNETLNKYLISTSDGFYLSNEQLQIMEKPEGIQPPVSVMGCNALQQVDDSEYIVGSFSGIFSWNLSSGGIYDIGTRSAYVPSVKSGRPISNFMVYGLVYFDNSNIWYADYNKGIIRVVGEQVFPLMPKAMLEAPMSLWNLCLEIHTGRIFESILGSFYILYVPLSGICVLIVLISGFFLWYWVYRGKKKV